jgi:hypothetical protein
MYEIDSKQKQMEGSNMVPSTDHAAEGKKYLEKGLELVRKGDIDNAVDCFYHAAIAFDRAQEFKQIPALWQAIGIMLEPDFKEKRLEYLNALQSGKIQDVYEKWYQFPLTYPTDAASEYVWKKHKDPAHRQAWVYEWAARYLERSGLYLGAYTLFFRAAEKAELTEGGKNYPNWPARLYQKAALNFILAYGTIEHALDEKYVNKKVSDIIKEGIKRMERHFLGIKDRCMAYRFLALSYRLLKSNLIETGNLAEAEQFKRKERSALMHYYFHRGSYFRAVTEWLSGIGFKYFIAGLFLMILFVFPWIYYQWNLVASAQGKITYLNTILYSIESALGIGHDEFYAVGYGRLLNIIEATLSWLGLGVFIWWLTRRLE